MKKVKICKYCHDQFEPRRNNHMYCSSSCRTQACYQRNNYKYVSGHYKRKELIEENKGELATTETEVRNTDKTLEVNKEKTNLSSNINSSSIKNSAIGSVAAGAAIYAAKSILAPHTLPATKGDITAVLNKMERYHKVENLPLRADGTQAYFDLHTKEIVYLISKETNPSRWV